VEGLSDDACTRTWDIAMTGATVVAELGAAAETVAGYVQRVGDVARLVGTDQEDVRTAIDEAARSLRVAERALRRAIKVASA
jgi:hypothetical protein